MRAAGWPAASTVASAMAFGSCTSARRASSNQRWNCAIGSACASASARPAGRIVAPHRGKARLHRPLHITRRCIADPRARGQGPARPYGAIRPQQMQIRLRASGAFCKVGRVRNQTWGEGSDATQSAATDLGGRRRCGQRLAADPARLCQRDHGRPGLGQPDRGHAARARRLRQCADHAAGDLGRQRHAARPRALERARHHHEDARRRLLRHHLPDDQHAPRRPSASSAPAATRPRAIAASARPGSRSTPAPTTPPTPTTP